MAALELVGAVLDNGEMLSVVLEASNGPLHGLGPEDRARAQRLALTTLRHLGRADACLKPYLRKAPPPVVHNILRLATVELCEDRAAAHGVVDCAVALTRGGYTRQAGLVNAVLRSVSIEGRERWADLPAPRLPGWLRGRMLSAYGAKTVAAIEAVQTGTPPLDLTLKQGTDAAALADALGGVLLPTGSLRLAAGGQVSALDGYESGDWWVQDAAAALPARLLAAQSGERVLDLCAAPGGKTLQLADAGAEVTALDISGPRLARLLDNLERTGLTAEVVTADALVWQSGPFDAVLLDAPCSATGTIRRHPDLPYVKDASDIKALALLQGQMIDRAMTLLQPGGRLVFCTCSLLPDEGEAQITAALARHPDLTLDDAALAAEWIDPAWRAPNGLRIRPDHWADTGGIDGFFISALRKSR
ncbi:16S rRNA methyltransferase [Pseudoruegeria sp. SK021]|nr:16S rRNA methyltransferase [Pseudoruegeria sp. SK021]